MSKKRNVKSLDEFRDCHTKERKGHPTYVYARVKDEFKYIGITHARITDHIKNIPLEKNPDPFDKDSAYLRPITSCDKSKHFGKPKVGWKFTQNDNKKVKDIIDASTRDKQNNKDIKALKKKGRRTET